MSHNYAETFGSQKKKKRKSVKIKGCEGTKAKDVGEPRDAPDARTDTRGARGDFFNLTEGEDPFPCP
jgi:hypothetical protein